MKVVLIYRRQKEDLYSLEELFKAIAVELRRHVEIIEYQAGPRRDTLKDALRLRKMRADIYHITGDVTYFALLLPHKKTVLTVPDIVHYLVDLRGLKQYIYKWLWMVWPIRAAGGVTAISGETLDNMVNHLNIVRSRIEIIECCHSALFTPAPRPFNMACPVILQVGTRQNKNVPRLIEALRGVRCRLVLIGKLDMALREQLEASGIEYVSLVNLAQDEIYRQYVGCDMVSFASLAEGFGMPIIEAQAVGRPLITSNLSPMREVAGAGACLVNPLEVSQIRQGVLRIIADPGYREQLVKNGLRNVARYSPAKISGQYLDLYRRMAFS